MAGTLVQFSVLWAAVSAALYIFYLFYKLLRFGHREKYLPPGPPTILILGNAHLIKPDRFHDQLKEWSDQYGPVYSLKLGKTTAIVLNDRRAVHDLVEKRSNNYSERSNRDHISAVFGDEAFSLTDTNAVWRATRKITARLLTPIRLDADISKIQEAEISGLMHDILTTPENFRAHMKRTTASIASIVIYGQRAVSQESFWFKAVYETMDAMNLALEPGNYFPVEHFPILKYLPDRWNTTKQRAEACYRIATGHGAEARRRVEKRRELGDKRDSLLDKLISGEVKSDVPLTDQQLNGFALMVYMGAGDTTSTAMLTNILFLAAHPAVQEKAHVELDRVCGTERVPQWTDFDALPYINCIIKEGLRIRAVAPTGVPHRSKQDDWYEGMFIPADSLIFIPIQALHNTYYANPDVYNPDRYLNHPRLAMHYASGPDYMNRDHYGYGAGRRICAGIHLAERTQWRIVARLLWGFKIEPALDEAGHEIKPDLEAYEDRFLREPKPYKVRFVPRSEKHAEVIRRNFESVEGYLKEWEER